MRDTIASIHVKEIQIVKVDRIFRKIYFRGKS